MPGFRDLLRRLRFHGVPGAPMGFAVPVDRSSEITKELRSVLGLLSGDQAIASELVAGARDAAVDRRTTAANEAKAILAQARELAPAARATELAMLMDAAAAERAEVLARAQREVERIEQAAAERTPRLASEIAMRILAHGAVTP